MSMFLDRLLNLAESYFPESKGDWISDLRTEAAHVPAGLARMKFQWSGLLAAVGHLLRVRFGPQKMGQLLLASALYILCLGGLVFSGGIEDDIVKFSFYCVFPLYALAGSLAVINLVWMKRYTVICVFLFCSVWALLSFDMFATANAHREFLRAFTIEAAFIMVGLFIAASYLEWIEEAADA